MDSIVVVVAVVLVAEPLFVVVVVEPVEKVKVQEVLRIDMHWLICLHMDYFAVVDDVVVDMDYVAVAVELPFVDLHNIEHIAVEYIDYSDLDVMRSDYYIVVVAVVDDMHYIVVDCYEATLDCHTVDIVVDIAVDIVAMTWSKFCTVKNWPLSACGFGLISLGKIEIHSVDRVTY